MKKKCAGYATVEAAIVMGVALLVLALIIFAGLYLHDQNIMLGAATESVQIAREQERNEESGSAKEIFSQRSDGKLLYFPSVALNEEEKSDYLRLIVSARTGRMAVKLSARAALTEPEKEIRKHIMERKE